MKTKLLSLISISLLIVSGNLLAGAKEDAFEKAFLNAHSTSDDALFSLVEFNEGTPEMFDEGLKGVLRGLRDKQIERVEFIEPKKEVSIDFEYEGVTYTSTLPIQKVFEIYFMNPEVVTVGKETSQLKSGMLNLGLSEGQYRIAAIKPKK